MKPSLVRCLVILVVSSGAFVRGHGQNGAAPQAVGTFACGACFGLAEDGSATLVPLESTEVVLDVKPGLLEAEVIQTFSNRGATPLEAIYRYPLPPAATLTHFELRYRDRVIVSEVREKEAARAAYEVAKAEGRKTALLEKLDPTLFSTAVANFLPGETVTTVLRFIQPVELRADVVEVRFPMVTGTKYFPEGSIPGVDGASAPTPPRVAQGMWGPGHAYAFDIQVSGLAVERIESDSHRIRVESSGAEHHAVMLEDEVTVPDRDFVMRITRKVTDEVEPTWVAQRTVTGDYGMLTVYPPRVGRSQTGALVRPRDILFLVDQSGSMSGERLASAKIGVDLCLKALRPDDRFQIVRFSTGYAFYDERWVTAGQAEVDRARAWVRELRIEGGTELQKALAASLEAFEPVERDQVVIALTDGDVGAERALVTMIEEKLGRARVFVLGIGEAPNPYLIAKMAECGRGQARFIAKDEHIARELADLFATLDAPVFTGAQLAFFDGHGRPVPFQTFPELLPDVFAGRPIQSVVRFTDGLPAGVMIQGMEGGMPVSRRVALPGWITRGDGLEKLFGNRWISDLEDMRRRAGDVDQRDEIKREIVETALLFQLVTEFTSRVAVDRTTVARLPSTPLATVNVAQAQVADQGVAVDLNDPNDPNMVVLSPFEVSCSENEGSYAAANTLAGSRLRTDLRDVASCIQVVTREVLSDMAATSLEETLPYMMDLEQQPAVASGADKGLVAGMPIATILAPEVVDRMSTKSFGPSWSDVELRQAGVGRRGKVTARMSDDGYAAGVLEMGGALDAEATLPMLALVSWDHFEGDNWNALVDARKQWDTGHLRGSLLWRDLEGYGQARSVRATWQARVAGNLQVEITGLRHHLARDDAEQFHLERPDAQQDGLGFFNLDLLTVDTASIEDSVLQARLSGVGAMWGGRHSWVAGACWHRRDSAWIGAIEEAASAPRQDTWRLDIADQVRLWDGVATVTPSLGLTRYRTPGQSQSAHHGGDAALEMSIRLTDVVGLVGSLASEEFLPVVPTGSFVVRDDGLVPLAAETERHSGGQIGLRVNAWYDRLVAQVGWFHTTIAGLTYRDWRWELEHGATGPVWVDETTLRQTVGRSTWHDFDRQGWIGSLDVNPWRELTATASWCIETEDAGPYRGGNRRASLLARYRASSGLLARCEIGLGAAWRNDMTFDDGFVLEGGVRCDLMLGYTFRTSSRRQTRLQVNWIDLGDGGLQPTRFAVERESRVLLSISHSF